MASITDSLFRIQNENQNLYNKLCLSLMKLMYYIIRELKYRKRIYEYVLNILKGVVLIEILCSPFFLFSFFLVVAFVRYIID